MAPVNKMKKILLLLSLSLLLFVTYQVPSLARTAGELLYYDKQIHKWDKTGIIAVRKISETKGTLVLEVEYRYNGEAGSEITLRVTPEGSTTQIPYWPQQTTKVVQGRNKVKVVLNAPKTIQDIFNTDLLTVSMNYIFIDPGKENKKYLASIMRRTFPFKKLWDVKEN